MTTDVAPRSSLPPSDNLVRRLAHPHYILNSLLCLPFPLLVLLNPTDSSPALTTALIAGIVLLALSVASRRSSDNIEFLHAGVTFQLRLFNAFGLFFTRKELQIGHSWISYIIIWLAVSFFLPQPPYLGPSALKELTSDEFDTQILLLPAARSAALAFASAPLSDPREQGAKIVELPDEEEDEPDAAPPLSPADEQALRERYHLVLFHVDYSKKSRELEMTLARLSHRYSSPRLAFSLVDPAHAPTTFYDLGLSAGPTSLDLPLLRLYRGGKVVQQAPMGEGEAKERRRAERRKKRAGERYERKGRGRKGGKAESESESGSDEDESEDEREVEREMAMSRYKWDRSAAAIERTFKLRERSGLA
ncbi:hypothetical protein JCM5296_004026 [Sporobolomyces johnsonii]